MLCKAIKKIENNFEAPVKDQNYKNIIYIKLINIKL